MWHPGHNKKHSIHLRFTIRNEQDWNKESCISLGVSYLEWPWRPKQQTYNHSSSPKYSIKKCWGRDKFLQQRNWILTELKNSRKVFIFMLVSQHPFSFLFHSMPLAGRKMIQSQRNHLIKCWNCWKSKEEYVNLTGKQLEIFIKSRNGDQQTSLSATNLHFDLNVQELCVILTTSTKPLSKWSG